MFDPNEILEKQFTEQTDALEAEFGQQESILNDQFMNQARIMKGQYDIERKYLEQTPMDFQQREQKVRQLNQKHELMIYKLKMAMEPHTTQLQSKKASAMADIQARRQEATQRIRLVNELQQSGKLTDPVGALQEQLQAVGVSIPITQLRGPKPRTAEQIEQELRAVDASLRVFQPYKEKKPLLDRDGNLLPNVKFAEFEADKKPRMAREEERVHGNELLRRRRELIAERDAMLLGGQGDPEVGRWNRALNAAGGGQTTPFAQGVASQVVSPSKPKNDPLGLGL